MFIVIEGIEGCGKTTVINALREKFNGVMDFKAYPDANFAIGRLIRQILSGEIKVNKEALTLLFISDFLKDRELLLRAAGSPENHVIADRYFLSTLAYEGALGVPIEAMLDVARSMGVVRPDMVLLLDLPPEMGLKRKKDKKEIFEKDVAFLERVRKIYLKIASEGIFADHWEVIDATMPKRRVIEAVISAVEKVL